METNKQEAGDAKVEDVQEDLARLNARGTAGVLSSHALSADVHIHNFSMTFHGKVSYPQFHASRYSWVANRCPITY